MTATVHQTIDTIYNADSVEWCPIDGFQDLLLSGTYQLEENEPDKDSSSASPQVRVGRLYLYSLQNEENSLKLNRIWEKDMPGILDIKWCSTLINGHPTFGLVNSVGQLQLYCIDRVSRDLNHVTQTQLCDGCLGLSLDWNNVVDSSLQPQISSSDSTGSVCVYSVGTSGLEKVTSWAPHDFEAWITAFNQWDPNIVFSGGDDCLLKGWDLRMYSDKPVFTSKRHTMGVCSIQSSPVHEHILATGSYDEQLLIWDSRQMKRPIADIGLGGGIWRIKWEPVTGNRILTATMYNGFHIVDTSKIKDGSIKVSNHFQEHKSIGYGADWCRMQINSDGKFLQTKCLEAGDDLINNKYIIATCSFYDHILKLWEFQAHNKDQGS